MYFYRTYGLVIASELVLPELVVVPATDAPDVTIILGSVPEVLEGATYSDRYFQVAGNVCHIVAKGVARYRIEEGQRIVVDAEPGVADGDVRLYLLGSALGAVLHQRQCFPLHVSSVVTPNGVWAFTGASGAGKSTLAANLHYKFGWPLLSDDVGVILPNPSEPVVFHAGPQRLKLWQDTLEQLNISQDDLTPDLIRIKKFHIKLDTGFQQQSKALRTLVLLERANPSESASLIPVNGLDSFKVIMTAIYRPNFASHLNDSTGIFKVFSLLSRNVQVYRYRRPWNLSSIESSLEPLLGRIKVMTRV